jgi:hypothetical protein
VQNCIKFGHPFIKLLIQSELCLINFIYSTSTSAVKSFKYGQYPTFMYSCLYGTGMYDGSTDQYFAVLRIRIRFMRIRIQAKIKMRIWMRIHELPSTASSRIPVQRFFQIFILKQRDPPPRHRESIFAFFRGGYFYQPGFLAAAHQIQETGKLIFFSLSENFVDHSKFWLLMLFLSSWIRISIF